MLPDTSLVTLNITMTAFKLFVKGFVTLEFSEARTILRFAKSQNCWGIALILLPL